MTGGNGNASLAVFGQTVTPNLYAMVNQFVLFDNFWKSIKGIDAQMPAPRRSVIPVCLKAKTVSGKAGAKAARTPAHEDDGD